MRPCFGYLKPIKNAILGPIFRIKLGLQNVVVLSSAEAAWDLLEKRSSIYSSRPRAVMAEEIVSKGLRLTFMP